VPAATLLLPYFEVDLNSTNGITTLFSVNNASAAAQLAHVTLWTDNSRPTLDFTIYLTGYDIQTFNLGQLFRTGDLPFLEGPLPPANGLDPAPSTQGPRGEQGSGIFSEDSGGAIPAAEVAPCTFPLPTNIGATFLDYIQRVHTGRSIPGGFAGAGSCIGTVGGGSGTSRIGTQDLHARGYLTVDVVRNCSQFVVTQNEYFQGRLATDPSANVLWGDFFLVNPAEDFAQGETLVHIETYTNPAQPGDYTFYGRYTPGAPWSGEDNREPLATVWGIRYLVAGIFTGGTDLLCWRDDGNNIVTPFDCAGVNPDLSGQPLSQNQVVIFDEEENPVTVQGSPFSPPQQQQGLVVCPWEANRTKVDGPRLPVPFDFGWLYLNLNTVNTKGDYPNAGAPVPAHLHQAWVGAVMSASGRFSVGFEGVAFDLASDPANLCLGPDTPGADNVPNTTNPPCTN
jgi:hypothetical protein